MSNGRRSGPSGGRLVRIGGRHATNRKDRSHEVHANRRCARPGTVARAGADRATPTDDRGAPPSPSSATCPAKSVFFANHPLFVGQCQNQDPSKGDYQTLSHSCFQSTNGHSLYLGRKNKTKNITVSDDAPSFSRNIWRLFDHSCLFAHGCSCPSKWLAVMLRQRVAKFTEQGMEPCPAAPQLPTAAVGLADALGHAAAARQATAG